MWRIEHFWWIFQKQIKVPMTTWEKLLDTTRRRVHSISEPHLESYTRPSEVWIPHKTARGKAALKDYWRFSSKTCPTTIRQEKESCCLQALRGVLRLKPGRKYTTVGKLSSAVGWNTNQLVEKLEEKRKVQFKLNTTPRRGFDQKLNAAKASTAESEAAQKTSCFRLLHRSFVYYEIREIHISTN